MYPKWITRAPGIGPVLVQDEKEEKQLREDWDAEQLALAEEAAAEAKVAAVEAEKAAKLALAGKNGK
jgi:hypothetical protein